MKFWRKTKRMVPARNNNRVKILMAIIFLLGASAIVKLINLQVREFDYYVARASGQHQISNVLEPERGKIFIQGNPAGDDTALYPLATNKEFFLVYAVPKEAEAAEELANIIFEIFDKEAVEAEAGKAIENFDTDRLTKELEALYAKGLPAEELAEEEQEIRKTHDALIKDNDYLLMKQSKKDAEIEKLKEEAIAGYLKIFNKKNDPYEPLKKKVEEETLKRLYSLMAADEKIGVGFTAGSEGMEIKDDKVWVDKGGKKEILDFPGIGFITQLGRFYPEGEIGSHITGFVGFADSEERGRYGLEGFFDSELYGKRGMIETSRDGLGNPIVINDREYSQPVNGSDLTLTINRTIQFTACTKLEESAQRHGANGGTVIIMEPTTGAIMALCSWPDYDPNKYNDVEKVNIYNNPAIFSAYEPGSTFKSLTMAAALDQEKVNPHTTYKDEGSVMVKGWDKPIKNSDFETHGGWGVVDMTKVLENSLNTGAIFAMGQIGPEVFARYIKDFGFGEKTGVELETESAGDIKNLQGSRPQDIYAATASFGQGLTVTSLQMISAYAAIANGGMLVKPYLVKNITHADGFKDVTQPKQIRRVISERAATLLTGMLVNAVENGHAKRAAVPGYYVAGKTGTAQVASAVSKGYGGETIHTFIGYAPAEDPKFVMLVKLDDPKDAKFAESTAVPLFGEIAEFLLKYYQVPVERK